MVPLKTHSIPKYLFFSLLLSECQFILLTIYFLPNVLHFNPFIFLSRHVIEVYKAYQRPVYICIFRFIDIDLGHRIFPSIKVIFLLYSCIDLHYRGALSCVRRRPEYLKYITLLNKCLSTFMYCWYSFSNRLIIQIFHFPLSIRYNSMFFTVTSGSLHICSTSITGYSPITQSHPCRREGLSFNYLVLHLHSCLFHK